MRNFNPRRPLAIAAVTLAAISLTGCGRAGEGEAEEAAACGTVDIAARARLAEGVPDGIPGRVFYVSSGHDRTPWIFAAEVDGRVAAWATDMPLSGSGDSAFIQAVNRTAWEESEWGSLGDFDANFPDSSISSQPDDSAVGAAISCARNG